VPIELKTNNINQK